MTLLVCIGVAGTPCPKNRRTHGRHQRCPECKREWGLLRRRSSYAPAAEGIRYERADFVFDLLSRELGGFAPRRGIAMLEDSDEG
jgi:hypothetical protein